MAPPKRSRRSPVTVAMRLPSGDRITEDRIRNISLGGVFIDMPEPLAFGSELKLEFTLPSNPTPKQIACEGFVIWSTRTNPDKAGGLSGIGVRLEKIGIAEMRALAAGVGQDL